MSGTDPVVVSTLVIFAVAFVFAFMRLLRGPSLPDRVVSLDLMAVIVIGFIAAYAIHTERRAFVDVATVVALIGFLATVAFAYHVRREGK